MSATSFIERPLSKGLLVPPGQNYLAQPLMGMPGCDRQVYVTPQARPVFPDPKILQQGSVGTPGKIFTADLGGKTDVIVDGPWDSSIVVDGASGQRGIPLRMASRNKSNIIGKESNAVHGWATLNTPNFWELYDLNLRAGNGQSAITWGPIATVTDRGSVIRVFNCKAKNIGYAGLLFSVGIAGYEYKKAIAVNFWIDGLVTDGEPGYFGHDTTESRTRKLVLIGLRGSNKGRETDQERYVDDARIYNVTGRNIGRVTGQPGQNNTNQVQNTNGFKKNCLYDGAPIVENIITHGFTFDGGFVRIDGGPTASGYIGKANDHWPGSPRLNASYVAGVKKIVIKNRFYYADNPTPEVYLLEETDCDVDVINCVVTDTYARFFTDIRAGSPSNVITQTNVKFVPKYSVPRPTFASDDVDSPDFQAITSPWHIQKGFGAGTFVQGPLDIVDAWEVVDQTVPTGTAFGSLVLPPYVPFLLSDGSMRMLAVTWAAGSYDGNTPATYSIFATPVLEAGLVDPFAEQVEQLVTVKAPSVIINLGGTSMAYVTGQNYNHIPQSFSTGNQTIKGENAGDTLASLRDIFGTLSGWGVNIISQFQGDVNGQPTAGLYPQAANTDEWTNPAGSGGRQFKITGLTNGHAYVFKMLCSVNSAIGGAAAQTCDVTVSGGAGGSGGGTFTAFNEKGNVTNLINGSGGVSVTAGTAGEVTITLTKNTNSAMMSVVEIVP